MFLLSVKSKATALWNGISLNFPESRFDYRIGSTAQSNRLYPSFFLEESGK